MGTIGRGAFASMGGVEIQNILSADLNGSIDMASDTTNDSNGFHENCYADQQVTLDITCKYAEATGIEDVMQEFYTNRAGATFVFTPISGGDSWSFTGRISSLNVTTTTGETIEVSFTVESSGTITFTEA
jgi:hypothetical protein